MVKIRKFEEETGELFFGGELPGFAHLYIGQEAVATGCMAALEPGDYITSNHRGHGHLIAKGGEVKKMLAEIMGKASGYCKGKGGSMHIASFSLGILGAFGIVGGGVGIGVGASGRGWGLLHATVTTIRMRLTSVRRSTMETYPFPSSTDEGCARS